MKEVGKTEIASDGYPENYPSSWETFTRIIIFYLALLMILGSGIIMNIAKGTRKKYFGSFKSGFKKL